jgi:hypothetical protein
MVKSVVFCEHKRYHREVLLLSLNLKNCVVPSNIIGVNNKIAISFE